ncbi:MAG TPA: amidohydrolase family protein [Spirochaetia bacterium]|nr:amidohydrolase family protein [Spirochaetales bacterium]HQK33828.1 amidohydrolase family protein [Spirochaetales bacterium]HRS65613.1 amidohydrolase family protein [Spirochaetia bacterium]
MRFIVDVHCHIMTLSRPNVGTFIDALAHRPFEYLKTQISAPKYLLTSLFSNRGSAIRNTIAVADNDASAIIGLMHDDLAGTIGPADTNPILHNGAFHILGDIYDSMIICPLLMDFSRPARITPDIYYNQPTEKHHTFTILEILHGIRQYLKEHQKPHRRGFLQHPAQGRLIVRPFLGVDPSWMTPDEVLIFLNRYFRSYKRDLNKQVKASLALEHWDGSLNRLPPALFSGIKLYPPLGFDPWPDNPLAREACKTLYQYCEQKQIPITTHCDDGGYRVIPLPEAEHYTNPERWLPVLEHYPELYLNFAHFGHRYQENRKTANSWTDSIVTLMNRYPHIYTDVSFNGCDFAYWTWLETFINSKTDTISELLRNRIMFGTDFLINLLKIDSYRSYIKGFLESDLDHSLKRAMLTQNPLSFLFI